MTSPQRDRAARARARRAADLAAREALTLEMLADRLPDYSRRVAFPAFWNDVKHIRGILGRDGVYRVLSSLDGARLDDDGLIVRISNHERTARRFLVARPRLRWDAQRDYLRRFQAHGGQHPPRPISYRAAHARVRAERGPASAFSCEECGERAAEWSYCGWSIDEQIGEPFPGAERDAPWSPNPAEYDPLCSRCHWERDELALWMGLGPTPEPKPVALPTANLAELPTDAPAWLRAMAPEAATR